MSGEKTVFVLGAGASVEFGLPTGDSLKELISKLLSLHYEAGMLTRGDELIADVLRRAAGKGYDGNGLRRAALRISEALPLAFSIDNYLHNHNNDPATVLCGKLAIVRAMLRAERQSKLFVKNNSTIPFQQCADTWAARLVRLLTEQCPLDDLAQRLASTTFIIFNYDRCLEFFLNHAFAVSYGISEQESASIVRAMNIYHPYGTVGNLEWLDNREGEIIGYGGEPSSQQLFNLAQGIKTFTEGTDPSASHILGIRDAVSKAKRFVFLGYAYHPQNMDLLLGTTPKSTTTRMVHGTAYNMSRSDTDIVQMKLDASLFAPSAVIDNEATCAQLFHKYSRSLSFT
jgi:hypothetical protein